MVTFKDSPTTKHHQSNFPHAAPAQKVLTLLAPHTRFILRLVSRTVKLWVDTESSPLRSLKITFPLSHYSVADLQTFHRLSPHCCRLTVKLLPSTIKLPESASSKADMPFTMLNLTSLTHLDVVAPAYDDFYPLLAFRLVLQAASVPILRHMTISTLSVPGVMAMRWGPLTSFGKTEWTGAHVWRGLTSLEVGLMPWDRDHSQGAEHSPGNEEARHSAIRVQKRLGTRVLHDWLASFAASDKIERIKIWWCDGKGLNPLLLDILSVEKNTRTWHSLKPVKWKGLKELWLGKCRVAQEDVGELRARCEKLEELWVEDKYLDENVEGKPRIMDGTWWTRVQLHRLPDGQDSTLDEEVHNAESEAVYTDTVDLQDYEEEEGASAESGEIPVKLDLGNAVTLIDLLQ